MNYEVVSEVVELIGNTKHKRCIVRDHDTQTTIEVVCGVDDEPISVIESVGDV